MINSARMLMVVLGLWSTVCLSPVTRADEEKKQTPSKVEGVWATRWITHLTGETLQFTFARDAKGNWLATIDLPEYRRQQQFKIVAVDGDKVRIKEFGITVIFEAEVSKDGGFLEGKVQMGGVWRSLKLNRLKEKPELRRPQEPTKPYPYHEKDVSFANNQAKIRLAGTLTWPSKTKSPHPAVLLLSGSGPDDRNYLAAGHYWFLVLSDYLTRRGFAVLRVDDRGVGKSTGNFAKANTADLVHDARAAVEFLKQCKEVDPKRIGVIGHSDGANVASLLAGQNPDIAMMVLLGGPGLPGEQIMLRQTEQGWKALGANEPLIEWNLKIQQRIIDTLKNQPDVENADKELRQVQEDINRKLTDEEKKRLGVSSEFKFSSMVGSTAWLRNFVLYDPRPALKKVACPTLVLGGEKDLIVASKENLPEIDKALRAGGNQDVKVKELTNLNHFFQTCKIGAPFEYFLIEETFNPEALATIGDWLALKAGLKLESK